MYRIIFDDNKRFSAYVELYVYMDNVVYRVEIEQDWRFYRYLTKEEWKKDLRKLNDFQFSIFEEYHFDKKNRPIEIERYFRGQQRGEKYDWIHDDVAFVTLHDRQYILIKNADEVLGIFGFIQSNELGQIYSWQTNEKIDFHNYTVHSSRKLENKNVDVIYAQVNDINGKPTEYYGLQLFDKKYIVWIAYLKTPNWFTYPKAKKVFKREILDFVDNKYKELSFDAQIIGIRYWNSSYSIMDMIVGFEENDNEDICSMTKLFGVDFSVENQDMISLMDDFINIHRYFNSFEKLMKSIQKDIEEKYNIKVILEEVID